jgi:probable phosphoglycerate mutase
MRLIIVRHGITQWNEEGRFQGSSNIELSELGKKQAKAVGERLRHEKFDAAYVSMLARAQQTADEILKYHPGVLLQETSALNEQHGGEIEGKTHEEVKKTHPYYFRADNPNRFNVFATPEGAESFVEVQARIGKFIAELKQNHAKHTVLIVAHGMVNKVLILGLTGQPKEGYYSLQMQSNCSVNEIEVEGGKAKVLKLNDIEHLAGL